MNLDTKSGQPSPELPSGTVTFLFTDIEGSTDLLKQLGEGYQSLLGDQRRILRDVFSRWNGQEVDTQGDAFFVSFPRATDAVNASIQVQRELAEHAWPSGVEVRVRMGLHTGEPWRAEEGYVGMDVHRAARIAHVGHGGQVLLSETTTALVLDDLPESVSLKDLGTHLLKDVSRPEHIRQLVIEGLPTEFPALSSLEQLPAAELREPRSVGECPYQGLSAFHEENAEFFFGREGFTDRLMDAVKTHPLVAVIVGSSGSGKSSAVFAGLLPQLRTEKGWSIVQFRPGSQPLAALTSTLLPLIEPDLQTTDRLVEARKLADAMRSGDLPLHDVVNRALDKNPDVEHLLVVVDQFEELYTLCQDEHVRSRFKDELLDVVLASSGQHQKRFVLLLTMRADFMGQALTHRPFADALQETSLLMGPMTREELRSAIQKPAEMQGAIYEAGLVERILDDVGEKPGNLPLLEFALTLLWEAQNDGWLTHADYEAIGSIDGALARYADEVFEDLTEKEKEQARRIFVQLVVPGEGTEDTRRIAIRAELAEKDWILVQHLADRRLVVTGRDADENETVEVVHEALIQRWGQFKLWMWEDRDFRSWQERLRTSFRIWEASDRSAEALLRGLPLTEAKNWRMERGAELGPAEKTYIQASLEERAERTQAEEKRQAREVALEQRSSRFLRALTGVFAAAAVIAIALSAAALNQNNIAQENAATAEEAREEANIQANIAATSAAEAQSEAEARATAQADAEAQRHTALEQASIGLGSQAALELQGTSPELAALLALEALENYPYTWQAERALGQAVFTNHLQLTLEHDGWANTAVWSPDQSRILTASDDNTAKVWDATTGDLLFTFEHDEWVPVALWSPAGDRILTHAGGDPGHVARLNIWDATSGELIRTIQMGGEEGVYFESDWSPDGTQVLVSRSDGNTKVWDVQTGDLIFALEAPRVCGGRCTEGFRAWSPSGDRILTRDKEGGIQIWNAASGEAIHQIQAHSDFVGSAAWSLEGDRVLSASDDGAIKIWNASDGMEVLSLDGHAGWVYMAMWSPSGGHIVSLGADEAVRVWNAGTGKEILKFDEHNSAVYAATWSPSGEHIVTGSEDGTAKVFNAFTGEVLQTFFGHDSLISFADWSPDGKRVITTGADGSVKIWNVSNETELLEIDGSNGAALSLAWSPDGSRLARSFEDGRVEIYDALSGSTVVEIEAHQSMVNGLAFSPSGEHIVTGSEDGTAKVWDAFTGALIATYEGHVAHPTSAEWSPDGSRIATAYWGAKDSTVRVWDPTTGEEQLIFSEHQPWGVVRARWVPDGSRIASVGKYGEAFIWDAVTGEVQLSLYPEENRFQVVAVAWSPGGDRLATHADDGVLRIWDAHTGEELITTPGHSAIPSTMEWHPSGDRIISGDSDGIIKMFDPSSGAEVFSVHPPDSFEMNLSPDGSKFATSSPFPGGPIKIFSIWSSLGELIDRARECCLIRELTSEERRQFGLPPV